MRRPRPIVVIDTSVFISDALSKTKRGTASQVLAILPAVATIIMCEDIREELTEKLVERFSWTKRQVTDTYGPIFDAALWLVPVEEQPIHRKVVHGDPDDTMLPRAAEAVFTQATTILELDRSRWFASMGGRWPGLLRDRRLSGGKKSLGLLDGGLGLGRRDEDRLVVHLVLDAQQSDQVALHPWPFGHGRLEDTYCLLMVVAPRNPAEPHATDRVGGRDATENRESRRNTTKRQHRVIRLGIHELSYGHEGTGRDQSRAGFVRVTCVGSTAGSTHREPPLAVRTSASIDVPPKCSPSRRQLATSGSSA